MYRQILGYLLIITSFLDAIKYYWTAVKIKETGTAKGHSRKFLNAAIFNDIIRIVYGVTIMDFFIISSGVLAFITMSYNYYMVYKFYPYRNRKHPGFKRPNILLYIWNSLLPNRIRKRL